MKLLRGNTSLSRNEQSTWGRIKTRLGLRQHQWVPPPALLLRGRKRASPTPWKTFTFPKGRTQNKYFHWKYQCQDNLKKKKKYSGRFGDDKPNMENSLCQIRAPFRRFPARDMEGTLASAMGKGTTGAIRFLIEKTKVPPTPGFCFENRESGCPSFLLVSGNCGGQQNRLLCSKAKSHCKSLESETGFPFGWTIF